jgi:phosphoribosylglycinamide formyltransferase-1
LNTHQLAIDAGDVYAGDTVHLVTAELDGGPAILQAKVAISADETAESLAKKVLRQEHIIYPMATLWFLQGRIRIAKEGLTVDQQLLGPSGLMLGADISA